MRSNRVYWLSIIALIGLAICLGRVTADSVETAPPSPVAVCDMPRVFSEFEQARTVLGEFRTLHESFQGKQVEIEAQFKTFQAELQGSPDTPLSALVPASPAYEERVKTIQTEMIEMRIWSETQQAQLQRQHQTLTRQIQSKIEHAVAAIAAERGIQLVLNRSSMSLGENAVQQLTEPRVLYNSDAVDLTEAILLRLNSQTPEPEH